MNKYLKQLKAYTSKPAEERNEDDLTKTREWAKKFETVCSSAVGDGEVPNPMKIIQMHLKHVLFNSEKVKGM